MEFEIVNELALKIHGYAGESVFTKEGAFIGGASAVKKNYQFEKVLLGPNGNPLAAALGQITRRFTGENLPLMKVNMQGESVTYYANNEQHITVIGLSFGERVSVESENILAFTSDCTYSVRFLAQGIISQKGLATSTLTGKGNNALVAVLSDGNPLVLSNMQNNTVLTADPDAIVCWLGADPNLKLDLSWKNLIGQASGESYMFEWNQGATIIIQPSERMSGIDISMDGRKTGSKPDTQQNQTFSQASNSIGDTLNQLGGMLRSNSNNTQSSSTIGNFINKLFK